jgi:hypothetical protein
LRLPTTFQNIEKNSLGVFKTFSGRHMIMYAPRRLERNHNLNIHHQTGGKSR